MTSTEIAKLAIAYVHAEENLHAALDVYYDGLRDLDALKSAEADANARYAELKAAVLAQPRKKGSRSS